MKASQIFCAALLVLGLLGVGHAELTILGEESPPGEYLAADGSPAGVTIDLVRNLLDRQGKTARIQILPWKRAYQMGLTERNIVLLETTRTPERENLFKWVGPILIVNRVIYALADFDRELRTIADLHTGGVVCVLRGSSNERYLQSLGIVQIDAVTKPAQCIKMLQSDRVQLFYTSDIGMRGLVAELGIAAETFKAVMNLKQEYLYLAFSRDVSDARIASWRQALEDAKRDGTVARIYQGVYPPATIRAVSLPGDPLAP
jgi:polar amino acid transport system substrate-binding protein